MEGDYENRDSNAIRKRQKVDPTNHFARFSGHGMVLLEDKEYDEAS